MHSVGRRGLLAIYEIFHLICSGLYRSVYLLHILFSKFAIFSENSIFWWNNFRLLIKSDCLLYMATRTFFKRKLIVSNRNNLFRHLKGYMDDCRVDFLLNNSMLSRNALAEF